MNDIAVENGNFWVAHQGRTTDNIGGGVYYLGKNGTTVSFTSSNNLLTRNATSIDFGGGSVYVSQRSTTKVPTPADGSFLGGAYLLFQ